MIILIAKLFSKKTLFLVLTALVLSVLAEVITLFSYPKQLDLSKIDALNPESVLSGESVVTCRNASLKDGCYTPTGEDPGLVVYSNHEDLRTIILRLSGVQEQFTFQMFYPDSSGGRDNACAISQLVLPGEDTVLIPLPEGSDFGYFWLDFDQKLQIEDIQISTLPLDTLAVRTHAPVSPFRMTIFFVGFLFLFICGAYFHWLQRLWERILRCVDFVRAHPVYTALGALAVIGAGVAGVVLEWRWSIMRSRPMLPPRALFYAVFAVVVVILFLLRHSLARHPERLFLVLVLGIGIILALCEPITKTTWDDETHYCRAVEVSFLDHSVLTGADEVFTQLGSVYNLSVSTQEQQASVLDQLNYVIDFEVGVGRAFNLERTSYIPMAVGIWLGRALHLSYASTFHLGKLTNLLFYALVVYAGMRRLRSGKMILAVVAMIPTALFQAANYSYDCFTVACIAFSVCYFLGELQRPEEPLSLKNTLLMLGGFTVGMCFKMVYFPLILLLLLMPREKFSRQDLVKWYRIGAFVVMLYVVGSYLLPFLTSDPGSSLYVGDTRGGSDVNAMGQFRYVLSHPFDYAGVLLRYLFTTYLAPDSLRSLVIHFAYMGYGSFFKVILLLLLLTAITDRGQDSALYSTWKSRIYSIVLVMISIAVTATSMYVNFTGVGADSISGLQPRYLLPLVFPTMALCVNNKLVLPLRSRIPDGLYNGVILGISSFILYWNVFWMFMPFTP